MGEWIEQICPRCGAGEHMRGQSHAVTYGKPYKATEETLKMVPPQFHHVVSMPMDAKDVLRLAERIEDIAWSKWKLQNTKDVPPAVSSQLLATFKASPVILSVQCRRCSHFWTPGVASE